MGRRTKDERRRDYLDIGAQLVAEAATGLTPDPGLALAHVKVADVAERAGVTKGALYHLWPSQEEYWHDLLEYLLEQDQLLSEARLAEVLAAAEGVADPGDPWSHADAAFELVRDDAGYFVRIGLHSYLFDDRVRARLDRDFRVALTPFRDLVARALRVRDRRIRQGFELDDLVVGLASLLQGLCLDHRIEPGRADVVDVDGASRTLFSVGAEALIEGMTEPTTGPG